MSLNETQVEQFRLFSQNDYRYKLYLDGLPSATMTKDPSTGKLVPDFTGGIPVGEYDHETGKTKIFNHLTFEVKVHLTETEPVEKHIVGFKVYPMSRGYDNRQIQRCDSKAEYTPQYLEPGEEFIWSYCYRTLVSSIKFSKLIKCFLG